MICRASLDDTDTASDRSLRNWSGDISFTARTLFRPTKRGELVEIVRMAEAAGRPVKAIGSLWSFTPVFTSDDIIVDTSLLNRDVSPDFLRLLVLDSVAGALRTTGRLAHVQAGVKVRDLNIRLHFGMSTDPVSPVEFREEARALPTMGGAGGQSLAGVLATGSHGSDLRPPLADSVCAIHLIGPGGQEWWIERSPGSSHGLTPGTAEDTTSNIRAMLDLEPALADEICRDVRVVKDDSMFHAALVSVGRMGIIYSMVIQISHCFLLMETRARQPLSAARSDLSASGLRALIDNDRSPTAEREHLHHLTVLVNPFRRNGDFDCYLTKRYRLRTPRPVTEGPAGFDAFSWVCRQRDVSTVVQTVLVPFSLGLAGAISAALALHPIPLPFPPFVFPIGPIVAAPLITAKAALDILIPGLLVPGVTVGDLIAGVANFAYTFGFKDLVRELLQLLFEAQYPEIPRENPKVGVSWRIMDTWDYEADCYKVDSVEFAFDATLEGDRHWLGFLDEVLAIFEDIQARNRPVAGVLSLRFTKATNALLGMSRFPLTCHVEIPILKDMGGNAEFLRRVQEAAIQFNGVPHWGQRMEVFTRADIAQLYGDALTTYRIRLSDVIRGGEGTRDSTFSNSFTRQYGLEPMHPIALPEICITLLTALGRLGGERRARTLREFRSSVLSATVCGRCMVGVYYRLSPSLVRWAKVAKWRKDLLYHAVVCPAAAFASITLARMKRTDS